MKFFRRKIQNIFSRYFSVKLKTPVCVKYQIVGHDFNNLKFQLFENACKVVHSNAQSVPLQFLRKIIFKHFLLLNSEPLLVPQYQSECHILTIYESTVYKDTNIVISQIEALQLPIRRFIKFSCFCLCTLSNFYPIFCRQYLFWGHQFNNVKSTFFENDCISKIVALQFLKR